MTIRMAHLPNGFRVATEFMPNFKTASLGIWIKAGGRHETRAENGMAHFLEHMAFKGTTSRTALEIAEAIENVGGYMNAYTSREITNYYTRILSEDIPLAVDVISDIVLNSTINATELDLERNVILQEIGQTNDTPDDIIFDWLQETAYPKQPLGRPILGSSKNIARFQRKDLIDFVNLHYSPERMILCAAGDIDHDKLVNLAEHYFGGLKKKAEPKLEAGIFRGGEKRVEKSLEQAHFALSFESPSIKSEHIFTGQIFSIILGGGMSSRLFQEIREKRGLCYSIYASLEAVQDTGTMTIYAGTSEEKISELSMVVIDEIRKSVENLTNHELKRSRAQIKAGLLMGLESTARRCERLARTISIWDRVVSVDETIEKINKVSLEDLRTFSIKLCTSGKLAQALYGPVKSAPDAEDLINRLSV